MTPTSTRAAILAAALQHLQHLVNPPARFAPAPRDAIRRSLLSKGLIEPAALELSDESAAWTVDGVPIHYRLTEAGLGTADVSTSAEVPTTPPHAPEAQEAASLAQEPPTAATEALPAIPARPGLCATAEAVLAAWDDVEARQVGMAAIGAAPNATATELDTDTAPVSEPQEPGSAPLAAPTAPEPLEPPASAEAPALRPNLRDAARCVLAAWDDEAGERTDLADAIAALCTALVPPTPAPVRAGLCKPREGTKQQQVLAMLRRSESATVAQISKATGCQAHTQGPRLLRRAEAAPRHRSRGRQVGPDKEGARGSYTVYRIAEAG